MTGRKEGKGWIEVRAPLLGAVEAEKGDTCPCLCACVCVRETMVSPPLVYSCPGVVPGSRPAPPPPGTVPSVQAATLPQRRTSESQTMTITITIANTFQTITITLANTFPQWRTSESYTITIIIATTLPQRRTSESQTLTITSKFSEHERGQVKTAFVTLKKHSTKCVDNKQSTNFEMTNNTATATCINKKEWRYAFSHQRVQPFLVIEASRLRRPLMTMGWLEEILFLFSLTLNRVGDFFKAIWYILFLFETLNRVGWLLYCSICAAQLFRLLRTKCRFIKQVSHSCIASPPESLRHISPFSPLMLPFLNVH